MVEERRDFPRLTVSVDIEYLILNEIKAQQSLSKNISAGGICLIVYEKIAIGSILLLKFRFPNDNQEVQAKGRVVWSSYFTIGADRKDRYDLGIEFTDIGADVKEKLAQHIFKLIK